MLMRVILGVVAGFVPWANAEPGETEISPTVLAGPTLGPVVGAVTETSARVLLRPAIAGEWGLVVWPVDGTEAAAARVTGHADAAEDFTTEFLVTGLLPATSYRYRVVGEGASESLMEGSFHTMPPRGSATVLTLAVGSCANDFAFKVQPIWKELVKASPDGLLLLGDTPYIDSNVLEKQRERRRAFMALDGLNELQRRTPTWATWDDHDFGKPDGDGRMEGKDRTRRAFIEYTANDTNGEEGLGVYTTFRFGATQVFLLDTRYFSRAEPSFADGDKLTLLGKQQWEWLKRELKASDAAFKILASGMIWNEAVRSNKDDYWMAYPHERAAVLKFIAEEAITGVVLLGGDIHRNRALKHPSEETGVPYPLYEIIASPLANTVIAAANQPHPALIFDAGVQHSAVLLTVDSTGDVARLRARWIDETSKELFAFEVSADELCPPR